MDGPFLGMFHASWLHALELDMSSPCLCTLTQPGMLSSHLHHLEPELLRSDFPQ